MHKPIFFLLALGLFLRGGAQKLKKEDRQLLENLRSHVVFLADDRLEGRRTGTAGEKLAADYIKSAFEQAGLTARGSNEFLQPFEVNEGLQIGSHSFLLINNNPLTIEKDYFPLPYSASTAIEALPSVALQEPKSPWFLDLSELLEANAANPHFDVAEAVYKTSAAYKGKGANAVFIYNTGNRPDGLAFDGKWKGENLGIPVVYLTPSTAKRFLADPGATLDLKLKTEITEKKRSGNNVVGFIDNGAASTVILGAHFDHLGYGEDGNSREVEKRGQIHNGADDNASGTAALIELARLLKASKSKNFNYLFLAFSGEELGLYGSKYFIQNPPVDLGTINYMINMDMVGRLNDSSHVVTVGGYGTSPAWGGLFQLKGKQKLDNGELQFRFDSSGTGPSDHTSFYLKGIPVLFYFTGLHPDYHKPTDDADKLNYAGELQIVKHIYSLVQSIDKSATRLAFTKTREAQTTTSARFSVTLGIMPDYTYSGAGVRVDGVSQDRPAQRAGVKTGDIILALGDMKISSLEAYMQALGTFKKGEKTTLVYQRDKETITTTVEF